MPNFCVLFQLVFLGVFSIHPLKTPQKHEDLGEKAKVAHICNLNSREVEKGNFLGLNNE